mgnify:CR=1 FL=1
MKRENIAILIAVSSFVFWIGQNQYFGWHKEAQSALEGFCDTLSLFGYFMAFLVKPISNTSRWEVHHADKVSLIRPTHERTR